MRSLLLKLPTVFLYVAVFTVYGAEDADCSQKAILRHIAKGDTTALMRCIRSGGIKMNSFIDVRESKTLLSVSIREKNAVMVSFLLRHGADPNLPVRNRTPLELAIRSGQPGIIRLLIDSGADVNYKDKDGYSAVYYGVIRNDLRLTQTLVEAGADLLTVNKAGHRPVDLITENTSDALSAYLKYKTDMQLKALQWPAYSDGPYVRWMDSLNFEMTWFTTKNNKILLQRKYRQVDQVPFLCLNPFTNKRIALKRNFDRPPEIEDLPDKLMIIGDVHGAYEPLLQLLQNNQVVDQSGNWKWGRGHLFFMGDFMDRGDSVTEVLWLVNRLENQAALFGGQVHTVLGNHEIMVLLNDLRYLHPKYERIAAYFALNHSVFFDLSTELGRFLRSKPAMVKIGSNLFVHAGISPDFLEASLQIDSINNILYRFLNSDIRKPEPLELLLLLGEGPFWFRGFLSEYDYREQVNETFIDKVLRFYDAERIIIGHSEVTGISSRFGGKVIAVNVPFNKPEIIPQALLFYHGELLIVDKYGNTQLLTNNPTPD